MITNVLEIFAKFIVCKKRMGNQNENILIKQRKQVIQIRTKNKSLQNMTNRKKRKAVAEKLEKNK